MIGWNDLHSPLGKEGPAAAVVAAAFLAFAVGDLGVLGEKGCLQLQRWERPDRDYNLSSEAKRRWRRDPRSRFRCCRCTPSESRLGVVESKEGNSSE